MKTALNNVLLPMSEVQINEGLILSAKLKVALSLYFQIVEILKIAKPL